MQKKCSCFLFLNKKLPLKLIAGLHQHSVCYIVELCWEHKRIKNPWKPYVFRMWGYAIILLNLNMVGGTAEQLRPQSAILILMKMQLKRKMDLLCTAMITSETAPSGYETAEELYEQTGPTTLQSRVSISGSHFRNACLSLRCVISVFLQPLSRGTLLLISVWGSWLGMVTGCHRSDTMKAAAVDQTCKNSTKESKQRH